MLRVGLLGGLRVELDAVPVELPEGRRARSLLAWLALHPGMHPRARLAARFWPDVLDASARASLRSAIWGVRRALGPGADAVLRAARDEVGIPPEAMSSDVGDVLRLLAEGRLEEAADAGAGELLPDLEEDWVDEAREEHRSRLAGALGELAARAEGAGDVGAAVAWSRRLAALDPLAEGPHRELMRRLAAAGDRAAALATYARLRDRLREQMGVPPSAETRAVAESLRAGRLAPAARPDASAPRPAPGVPPLVGREAPLGALLEAWRAARAGAGRVVAVRGEAGIGKTRLLLDLAATARADGARVAACAALDLGGAAPFGLWAELLRDLCRELEPPPESAGWPAELARLAPDLEARLGRRPERPLSASPELERARLFEAIVEAVEWAGRERPLLLVMEDVHQADAPSLELAGYVSRRAGELPLMIALSRRDLPRRAELDALEHALRARGVLAAETALGPLEPEPLAALVRSVAAIQEAEVRRVVAGAGGSPLLAVESARALARGERAVPASLRGAARASFLTLPPDARLLAELAAVAGRDLDRAEAEALPVPGLGDAATAAVESGLLVAAGGRIGYRHALLREGVYQDLPEPRRAALHEAVAAAIAASPHPAARRRAAEVARHLLRAGRERPAVEHLLRAAADARAVAALPEAADFLAEASRLAPADPRPQLELAEVLAWTGRRDEAEAAFGRGLALIGPGDERATARAWLQRARWMRGALCVPRAARDAFRTALATLDAAGSESLEDRAEALAGLAWAEAVAGDAEAVEDLLLRLYELTQGTSPSDRLAHDIGAARSFSLIRRGRFEESYGPAIAAAGAALRAGRPDMAYACWANASCAAACAGDFERSLEFAERGLAAVRGLLPTTEVHLLAGRAHILARLGRLDEARAAADAELELAERLDNDDLRALAQHDRGIVALAAGDLDRADELLAAALEGNAPVSRPLARLARAEALLRLERLEEAEEQLRATALEPVGPSDLPETLVPRLTRLQGLIAAARGDRELAERRLLEAADGWRRYVPGDDRGDRYVATLADLGRPPVAGLVEPARELEGVLAELATLAAAGG
jgi:DNA-binding SARP family transcriptional activator/tetratricopeptide (TPR) repeat protein